MHACVYIGVAASAPSVGEMHPVGLRPGTGLFWDSASAERTQTVWYGIAV